MNLFYQPLGNSWAVGIESDDPQKIISQDYSWYNHGAYNGELNYMSKKFAYIWTTEEDIKNYFYNSSLAYFLGKYGNTLREKVRRYARLLARLRFNNMTHETFISVQHGGTYRLSINSDMCGTGTMKTGGVWNDEEEWKQTSERFYNIK